MKSVSFVRHSFRRRRHVTAIAVCSAVVLLAWIGHGFLPGSILLKLQPSPRFERIELAGSACSGTVLDARGGWFNDGKCTEIVVRSKKTGGGWDRPSDITIRNGHLRGSVRIMGMGRNGQAREVRLSSYREGHTARAQAAAPTRIVLSNVWIEADHRIPVYLSPGVTQVTIADCVFTGRSSSVALYFDAESARNIVRHNTFATRVSREVLAVDGSAENCMEDNRFERMPWGGIYLYRNCGEGGTVRHQTPHGNVIVGNWFSMQSLSWSCYGVWLGSRNGRRGYCSADAGYPFGSSIDNRDFAEDNTVTNNVFLSSKARSLRDDGKNNRITR